MQKDEDFKIIRKKTDTSFDKCKENNFEDSTAIKFRMLYNYE